VCLLSSAAAVVKKMYAARNEKEIKVKKEGQKRAL
jgi:hypothetical protein